jgi:hypothetical protein
MLSLHPTHECGRQPSILCLAEYSILVSLGSNKLLIHFRMEGCSLAVSYCCDRKSPSSVLSATTCMSAGSSRSVKDSCTFQERWSSGISGEPTQRRNSSLRWMMPMVSVLLSVASAPSRVGMVLQHALQMALWINAALTRSYASILWRRQGQKESMDATFFCQFRRLFLRFRGVKCAGN